MCGSGILLNDGVLETNGITVSDTTMLSSGILLKYKIVTSSETLCLICESKQAFNLLRPEYWRI